MSQLLYRFQAHEVVPHHGKPYAAALCEEEFLQ